MIRIPAQCQGVVESKTNHRVDTCPNQSRLQIVGSQYLQGRLAVRQNCGSTCPSQTLPNRHSYQRPRLKKWRWIYPWAKLAKIKVQRHPTPVSTLDCFKPSEIQISIFGQLRSIQTRTSVDNPCNKTPHKYLHRQYPVTDPSCRFISEYLRNS